MLVHAANCANRVAVGALLLGVVAALASAQASDEALEWTNPLLGPRYAAWLVGAVGRIANEAERSEYLGFDSDAAAAEFIERFWSSVERRSSRPLFESRAADADRLFTEAAYSGRRTDRGTLHVLYGAPTEISFEEFRDIDDPVVEAWRYDKDAPPGLDGKEPQRLYRFVKVGDFTRLFSKGSASDSEMKRRRSRFREPPP